MSMPLGKFVSVFQSEELEMLNCGMEMLSTDLNNISIYIFSDSQAALKALSLYKFSSSLTLECLNDLGQPNSVVLVWVPGHSGIEGNEAADKLARLGSRHDSPGPEPCLPVPYSALKAAVHNWLTVEHARWWHSYPGGLHTKRFLPEPSVRWSRDLLLLDRKHIRRIAGAITGHCTLNKHLSTMGYVQDAKFACGFGEETGLHVICECPLYSSLRRKLLGNFTIAPSAIIQLGPIVLNRFLEGTKRFV